MTVDEQESSPYRRALETARALGGADGRLAAQVEPAGEPAAVGPWCRGLDPEHFAALVWGTAGGAAPAGVVLNAPLWYAEGYREALGRARGRQDHPVPAPRAATAPDPAGPAGPAAISGWPRPRRRR